MNKRLLLTILIMLVIGGLLTGFFSGSIQNALTLPMSIMMGMNDNGQQGTNKPAPGTGLTHGTTRPLPTPTAAPVQIKTNTLALDTFQRGDQTFWGRASDGTTWGGDANQSPSFSINGKTGKIAHGNGAVEAILGTAQSNVNIVVSGSVNQFGNGVNLGVVLRWKNADNWYKALLDGDHLSILRRVNGNSTQLQAVPFQAQAGQAYNIRFQAIGAMLFAKAWPAGQQEPTQWMIIDSDMNLTTGQTGIRVVLGANTVMHFNSFVVVPAHMTATL